MTQNRKRSRNVQEDEMEFMPLSKRINNLHLNNSLLLDQNSPPHSVQQQQQPAQDWSQQGSQYYNPPIDQQHLPPTPPMEVQNGFTNSPSYSPDLNERENPYYYNINKLLFEMYVERSQRNGNL